MSDYQPKWRALEWNEPSEDGRIFGSIRLTKITALRAVVIPQGKAFVAAVELGIDGFMGEEIAYTGRLGTDGDAKKWCQDEIDKFIDSIVPEVLPKPPEPKFKIGDLVRVSVISKASVFTIEKVCFDSETVSFRDGKSTIHTRKYYYFLSHRSDMFYESCLRPFERN